MKKTCTILLISAILSVCVQTAYAQFVLAQDTVRGRIDFSPRLGDMNNAVEIPNDSVFYMFPVDLNTDPWRQVYRYMPDRTVRTGYIQATKLMRVDDYDIVEVERLSAHGYISFKNSDVRIVVSVAPVTSKDAAIKKGADGLYTVNGRLARGVAKWGTPKMQYKSITVSIKGRNISVPKKLFEHLLEPDIEDMVVYYNPRKETVYMQVNNGGTSAYYTALFTMSVRGALSPYVFDLSMNR
jgi:hypothetical protein